MPIEEEYETIVIPKSIIKHLPPEWKSFIEEAQEGQVLLARADSNLHILTRLFNAYPTMASLRYIHSRLASMKFELNTEWMMEHDMLVLAFVTTYHRLVDGGAGSGVSRKQIPQHLREAHDAIIDLRHKRYAHNAGHSSTSTSMNIILSEGKFEIDLSFDATFQFNGAPEWHELVNFLDRLMVDRLHVQLERLKEKTGREWVFPSGPPPSWVSSDEEPVDVTPETP